MKSKPPSIFGAKLDVITAQAPCKTHHTPCNLKDLFFGLPQLEFHVNSTGGNEGMNPGSFSVLDSFPGSPNIFLIAPREATDDRNVPIGIDSIANLLGNGLHGLEIVVGGGGEASLDDVDTELGELPGNVEFFLGG